MRHRRSAILLSVGLVLAAGLAEPRPARAQASRLGATFNVAAVGGTRYNDVAYDPVNDVYLTVAQASVGGVLTAFGRFVSGAGAPLGTGHFGIRLGAGDGGRPRVSYGNGKFLVTWYDYRSTKGGQVFGRFVSYDAAAGVAFGPEFLIATSPGFLNGETSSPSSAYSSGNDEFLVVWMDQAGAPLNDIRAQRVSSGGALAGGQILISYDNHYQAEPAVAYNAAANLFYVAWSNYFEPAGPAGVHGRRVQSGTGALLDATYTILFTGVAAWIPQVVSNPITNTFFVGWYTNAPRPTHYGMLVGTNGAVVAAAAPVIVNYASYDGFGVAHNSVSNTYFAVFHGRNPSNLPQEDVGQEILPAGTPSAQGEFEVTSTGSRVGNFYPRLAASGRSSQWLVTTARDFLSLSAQLVQTSTNGGGNGGNPPPPPPPPGDIETRPDPTTIDLANAPNGSEYHAEGVASSDGALNFNTFYQLQNTTNTDAVVRGYFARQADGATVLRERGIKVKANSRRTVHLKELVGDGSWSAVFQSETPGVPIYSQQSVLWGNNVEGSTGDAASRALSPKWLFAEGTRKGPDYFLNYFLLFNPLPYPLTIIGEYFLDGSSAPITRTYNVPASGRFTVFANDVPELAGRDFSARYRSADGSSGFVAQRAMYWGANYLGGHSANGVPGEQSRWFFAEGAAAPNFDTYYTLLNPNPFDVNVAVTYYTATGPRARPSGVLTLKANSRGTIWLNGEVGNIGGVAALFETSGAGIVVERSVYWGAFPTWVEGTNDVGVNDSAMNWYLPEGSDESLFDTYVLLANPQPFAVNVLVSFYLDGGGRITAAGPITIPAQSRVNIDMSAPGQAVPLTPSDAALLAGKAFAVRVISQTEGGKIVVEEAVYRDFRPGSYWRAGSSAFGIPQ
jgi:hypothetical protein